MTDHTSTTRYFGLFLGTFVSSLFLIFGVVMLGSLFFPVVLTWITTGEDYQPQLPIAAERDESFASLAEIPPKQYFPSLAVPVADAQTIESGNWIRIPAIGVNVPLALSPSLSDEDVLKTLDLGAALYPNGIEPGRLGNTFVSAHSTGEPWKGTYRFAFLRINELVDGNLIHLDYEGTRYTYRIVAKDIVTPTPDFRVESGRPIPTVTLMACWPLWTTHQRMLITGELTNITKLTPAPS